MKIVLHVKSDPLYLGNDLESNVTRKKWDAIDKRALMDTRIEIGEKIVTGRAENNWMRLGFKTLSLRRKVVKNVGESVACG